MCGVPYEAIEKEVQKNIKTKVADEMLTEFNALSFDLNTYRRTH